jgi:hypothetical protein
MSGIDALLTQKILEIVITAAVPVVVGLIGYAGALVTQRIRMQMSQEQLAFADNLINRFVGAAQQYNLAGILQQSGEEKKAWVVEKVSNELKARGIDLNVSLLADLVEANILKGAKEPIAFTLGVGSSALPATALDPTAAQ